MSEQGKANKDLIQYGQSFMLDGKHIPLDRVMLSQSKQFKAFMNWFETTNQVLSMRDWSYRCWQAATLESEKRIAALEGEVAELKEQLAILKPNPLCDTSCLLSCSMEADYAEKQYLENQQLQASNNDLREALELCEAHIDDKLPFDSMTIQIIKESLAATPAKSLQAHDDVPVCEECNVNMHPFSHDGISGYSCDSCGWSVDDMKGK